MMVTLVEIRSIYVNSLYNFLYTFSSFVSLKQFQNKKF